MYKLHLILKYLRKRRIAWVSLLAVMLCTTMVLVVISVMGGWLRMFRTSYRGLSGDVIVQSYTLAGFEHYDEMIDRIVKLPEVEAAAPVIQTFGLININARKTAGVQVLGYPIERIGTVNAFPTSLWRQYNQWMEWADGAPIMPEDRYDLRRRDKLDVREPEPLLALTADERQRLKDAAPKVRVLIEKLKKHIQEDPEYAASEDAYVKSQDLAYVSDQIKALPSSPEGQPLPVGIRTLLRRTVPNVVDDPARRLAANEQERKLVRERGLQMVKTPNFKLFLPPEEYQRAFRSANPKASESIIKESSNWDGMIAGTGVVNIRKNAEGKFTGREDFLYHIPVSLTVMGVSSSGRFELGNKSERNFWIVDTSRTKVWQHDSNSVYVPFHVLQEDLGMQAQEAEKDGKKITIPARTSEIHIRLKPPLRDSTADQLAVAKKVQEIVNQVLSKKAAEGLVFVTSVPVVRTWEQSQSKWLGAIEKEMVLVTGLFGLISVVAVFLIFCIFYMIVVEKTRDIGIIKSVGATSSGVAGIFLGYGAAIGVLGAGLGFGLAYLIVHNINEIHAWLGQALNVQIWDPEVYAFDTIPNTMDPQKVAMILAIAVVASILGAMVPAVRAAKLNPVEALRWE